MRLYLQVVRQLRSPGLAWIHRDEHAKSWQYPDDRPLELALLAALRLLPEENQELLRDDRKHLNVDPVKLVEAAPGPRGGQALKELAHHDIVHRVGTVEHHALLSQGLRQILCGLSFACSGGASRGASQIQLQRPHQRHLAFIGERSDNQPQSVAQVLLALRKIGLNALHLAVVLLPVLSELRNPLERPPIAHFALPEIFHHILRMHVYHNQRVYGDLQLFREFGPHQVDQFVQLQI